VSLDVDSTSVRGVWVRHVVHGREPLFRPTPPGDGRWQLGAVVEGIYLAADEDTVWAEWYRGLAERGLEPSEALPRDLWNFEIDLEDIADLSTPAQLTRVGLPIQLPSRRQWSPFQEVGHTLFREGWRGIRFDAAARPGFLNLCVFLSSASPAGVLPAPPPTTITAAPVVPTGLRT
jgi:hypothetical protein